MKNIPERQKDILSIISSLDISPTMYKNAVEKYHAITKFLNDYGIDADMYPQGSFAFGTVIPVSYTHLIANVIGRFCIQRIFLWPAGLVGICSFILHDKIPFHKA